MKVPRFLITSALPLLLGIGCTRAQESGNAAPAKASPEMKQTESTSTESADAPRQTRVAMFGGGCFWCTEAFFERLPGVISVTSGYAGGETDNPTYKQICRGDTGHAEVVRIEYDPALMPYTRLLDIFFKSHDPTTLNRQGADVGTQYRSVIFYYDEEQKTEAEKAKAEAAKLYPDDIVTEVVSAATFYVAEDYHQDYLKKNPYAPYSRHIMSKMRKFDATFGEENK